ncbi:MAG: hypothetical protein A2X99_02310 [Deltaproteobacteria bacterium GWB2_55_19]|nr:MAG: hypothetical protein A2X99_02310 [Deltaproteobacteria bacterium GWB2_55_19]
MQTIGRKVTLKEIAGGAHLGVTPLSKEEICSRKKINQEIASALKGINREDSPEPFPGKNMPFFPPYL